MKVNIWAEVNPDGRELTAEEQRDLAIAAKAGDNEAAKTLVSCNIAIIRKEARIWHERLLTPLDDLVAVGCHAVAGPAIDNYDPAKGEFLSYAMRWVRQRIRLAMKIHPIRVPPSTMHMARRAKAERGSLKPAIQAAVDRACRVDSIDTRDSADDSSPLQLADPQPSPAVRCQLSQDITNLMQVFHTLPDRDQHILRMRYGLAGTKPKTLEEVSKIIGTSRERVRQLQNQALGKLRRMVR